MTQPDDKRSTTDTPMSPPVQDGTADDAQKNLDGWKRALADYDNLKRQVAQERVEFAKYATASLIQDLLPTVDYFHAALAHRPDLSSCDPDVQRTIDQWLTGIQHVQKLLLDTLHERGVTLVPTDGPFDATLHEAVEERESDKPAGAILEVLAPGYHLHDRLLRPARVVIATASQSPSTT